MTIAYILFFVLIYLLLGLLTWFFWLWCDKKYENIMCLESGPEDILAMLIWPAILLVCIFYILAQKINKILDKWTAKMYKYMDERSYKKWKDESTSD